MVTPDIHYIYHKNPEKFTKRDLNQIMDYMNWNRRNRVTIAFKTSKDLNESLEFLINYIEERVDFKIKTTLIQSNVIKLERRVEDDQKNE